MHSRSEERIDFNEGLRKLNTTMDSVINCMKAVKNRLDGIDQRINGLSLRVYALDEKTDTILFSMKNKDYDENSRNSKKKDWPLDTILKMSTGTPKSVADDSPKGVTTMIFDISDDEEDMSDIMSGHMAMKPMSLDRGKTILETVNEHIQPPTLHNNYKQVHMTDPLGVNQRYPVKYFLNVKSRFRPTSDMQLTELELKVVAYVFGYHHDEDEVLIKMREYVGGRKELHNLCPNKVVADKIIELAALKGTWKECQSSSQGVWYCPPRFAVRKIRFIL
ncbi:Ulp1 protease family, carboxy-terminal domain protein [Sesbania bispinosa]|nr:Ulp1 protease family, carboxy-terminal domain protein [Sesbania bispinosa]